MSQASDVRMRFFFTSTPERIAACKHSGLYWYASPADEEGWICVDCGWSPGEEPGYSPEHDRELISTKVGSVLHDMHEAGIIYVSNGTGGDSITAVVAARCKRTKTFDSVSIARFILEIEADARHREFWRDSGESIIAGKDTRDRCHCGKLAHGTTWVDGKRTTFCSYECNPATVKGVPF